MGPEALARRIAQKTNTPVFEQVLLGERPMTDLPMDCIPWGGVATERTAKPRAQLRWDSQGRFEVEPKTFRPYATIKYQGKRHLVHRLIYMILEKPNFEFRMTKTCCGSDLCVNPFHWAVHGEHTSDEAEPETKPVEEPPMLGDWTLQDVEELVEIALEQGDLGIPELQDAPPMMVREVLAKFNKEHLL